MRFTTSRVAIIGLVSWIVVSRVFGLLFYGLNFLDPDTAVLGLTIRSALAHGTVNAPVGYENGFGYQYLAYFVVSNTGVTVEVFQLVFSRIIGMLVLLVAYVLYKRMFGHAFGLLAVFVLSISDFFTAYTVLGSHNPYTTYLLLLMFASFFIAICDNRRPAVKSHGVVFIISTMAISTYNVYYSSSLGLIFLLAALATYLLFRSGYTLPKIAPQGFLRPAPFLLIIAFVVAFWVYPPSSVFIQFGRDILQQVGIFVSSLNPQPTELARGAQLAYVNRESFLLMQTYDVGITALAAVSFFAVLLFLKKLPKTHSKRLVFIIGIFAGYLVVSAISFAYDFSGNPIFGHADLRVFGFFAPILIIPPLYLLTNAPAEGVLKGTRKWMGRVLVVLILVGMLTLPLHLTANPAFFNSWYFHTTQEKSGLLWGSGALPYGATLYIGPDKDRLTDTYFFYVNPSQATRMNPAGNLTGSGYFLSSPLINDQGERWGVNLNVSINYSDDIVYSSGGSQIYAAQWAAG